MMKSVLSCVLYGVDQKQEGNGKTPHIFNLYDTKSIQIIYFFNFLWTQQKQTKNIV